MANVTTLSQSTFAVVSIGKVSLMQKFIFSDCNCSFFKRFAANLAYYNSGLTGYLSVTGLNLGFVKTQKS